MAWLPDGEKISKISLVVLAQLTNMTDGQTDGQTDGHRMPAIAALCIASHGKNLSARVRVGRSAVPLFLFLELPSISPKLIKLGS